MIKKIMKKFKKFILLNCILLLTSCSTMKSAFVNEKKNSTDEFLVEKKSPLVMPPDYNELPMPKETKDKQNKNENEFKKLITQNKQDSLSTSNKNVDKNFENSILNKIKNN